MSGIQKIIAVALLLMSCAFVYAAIDKYSTSKEKDQLDAKKEQVRLDERKQFEDDRAEYLKTKKGLESDKAKLEAQLTTTQGENKILKDELAGLQGKYDDITIKYGDTSAKLADCTVNNEDMAKIIKERNLKIDAQQAEISKLNADIADARQKQRDAESALENEITAHAKTQKKYDDDIAAKDVTIKDLNARLQGDKNIGQDLDVTCSVLSVSRNADFTLVSLNKGKEERLEPGVKLIVYNQAEEYKGTIEIISVKEGTSIAKIIDEVEGKQIAANDLATVKNW